MQHYLPQTDDDIKEMLAKIGVANFDELISTIPRELLLKSPLQLPEALSSRKRWSG